VLIDVESGHSLGNCLSEAISSILESESALYGLWVSDVREEVTFNHDFSATLVGAALGLKSKKLWLGVVAEEEASVDKVNAIE